jgi:hypothetical protein
MGRFLRRILIAGVPAALSGCMVGPLQENPLLVRPEKIAAMENPVYVPLGPPSYPAVFEKVIDVLDDYFEIAYRNRYDGRIETHPRIAPGLGQPWKPGSPDLYQRAYATLQTVRHRAVVLIQVADDGGFFIDVKVYKELEDVPKPTAPNATASSFQSYPTVERQFEVVDATTFENSWIPIGRDTKLEQVILARLACCKFMPPAPTAPCAPAVPPRP